MLEISNFSKSQKDWKSKIVTLLIAFTAIGGSLYFPGLGFLVYLALQKYLTARSKLVLVILAVIEVFQFLTAMGSFYGPVVSHIQ